MGVGQVQGDALFVAQGAPGLVEAGLGLAHPGGVHLAGPARGLLRAPLHVAGEDAGQPGVAQVAGGVARAALGAFAGLLHLPLLPLQFLFGVADVLLGDLLLGADGFLVLGEVAAVQVQFVAEFGDAFHAVEQGAVVADQEQAAGEVRQDVVHLVPGLQVEVVRGFVQQQHLGPLEELGGEPERDDLAAAEGAEPAVQGEVGEAQAVELGAGALLDVPVVADRGEVLLADVSGLDGVQGADHLGDADDLRDREIAGQGQALREVAQSPGDRHRAGGGLEFTRDQLEQGALAGAVGGDQARTARGHGEGQILEDRGVVGPGEGQVRADDGGVGHGSDLGGTEGRTQISALGRRGEKRYDEADHLGSALSAGRWPSDPALTRRCRRHPPRLRLLDRRSVSWASVAARVACFLHMCEDPR